MDNAQSNPGQQNGQQIQVKITDEVLKGVFSNMAQIGHTQEEFVIDFMNLLGGSGIVTSRVIISPGHAKRLVSALAENIKRFEEQFGKIQDTNAPANRIGFQTE